MVFYTTGSVPVHPENFATMTRLTLYGALPFELQGQHEAVFTESSHKGMLSSYGLPGAAIP